VPRFDLFEQPVADAPDPAARSGAAAAHVVCTHPLANGGWSSDFGGLSGAPDPDQALQRFLDQGLFNLPSEGYVLAGADTGRLLYTYSADGMARVAVIVAAGLANTGWAVETFASCDPAEYDSSADDQIGISVWSDADGDRVPTSIIVSLEGAEHCGWESITYLRMDEMVYVSDPVGLLEAEFTVEYNPDIELPETADDTGYRLDQERLWLSPDGAIAYLVSEDRVEQWPSAVEPSMVWCD